MGNYIFYKGKFSKWDTVLYIGSFELNVLCLLNHLFEQKQCKDLEPTKVRLQNAC